MKILAAFQVPAYDQEPLDQMVEWLHAMPEEWDGDPSGINIHISENNCQLALPGDWIVQREDGKYRAVPAEFFDQLWSEQ